MHSAPYVRALPLLVLLAAGLLVGCGPKKPRTSIPAPPPPPAAGSSSHPAPETPEATQPATAEPRLPKEATPIYVETGLASWYGAPYHNRRAANGQTYDMNAMTAAHRTLPLNSLVRVTNLKTGSRALVRITDRGPFVQDRILDLSLAAAKAVDVWRPGTARVRLEVLEAPAPIERGGRWAVQIGGFEQEAEARRIQDRLSRRYRTAKVLAFASPVGAWWVRVRVLDDDKRRAEEVAQNAPAPEENVFLVRLD